ncbi:MAG: PilZ domain-containing protein [Deltaproteobacteria bacterium]|nr:PilZ domain-containing protein [Deltaproteobacteria bacterium]
MSGNDNLDEAEGTAQPSDTEAAAEASSGGEPGAPTPDEAVRARREAGARRELNETVVFHGDGKSIDGWSLNISGGGLRAILDENVEVGAEFEMTFGDSSERRPVRVVWARQEKGGAIVGVAFLDIAEGSIPPPPSIEPPPGPVAEKAAPAAPNDGPPKDGEAPGET